MNALWMDDWNAAREHFKAWWNRDGLVLAVHGVPADTPHGDAPPPEPTSDPTRRQTDLAWRARNNRHALSRNLWLADTLPLADTNFGPGSLGTMLGAIPHVAETTVWYEPCMDHDDPESYPPLVFDPDNRWYRFHEDMLRTEVQSSRGNYLVGFPDLIENIDTLAALRGDQELMMDLVDRPDWVQAKLAEINTAYFEAFDRLRDIIVLPDGSTCFCAFGLWAPGTVAKVQCDSCAMFGPEMFERFVLGPLAEQCSRLDYSMYHLDGTQCFPHLDLLMSIDSLDAIEWTPQAGIEGGGNPRWYDLYRRILEGGKSVQAVGVKPDEVIPLLEACGTRGMHIKTHVEDADDARELIKQVDAMR